jgi:hypothetical protein
MAVTSVKPPTLHADGPCDGGLTKGMAASFVSCRSVWETLEYRAPDLARDFAFHPS